MKRIDLADVEVGMLVRRQWGEDDVVVTWSGEVTHVDDAAVFIGRKYVDRRENFGVWYQLTETREEQIAAWLNWFAANGIVETPEEWVAFQAKALLNAGMTAPRPTDVPTFVESGPHG